MLNVVTLILALVLAAAGGVVGYGIGHGVGFAAGRTAGASSEAASINSQGDALAKTAEAARKAAMQPGAFQRLRAEWCRNCTP